MTGRTRLGSVPYGAVSLAVTCVLCVMMLTSLAAVVSLSRAAVLRSRHTVLASSVALETMSTLDTLGCDRQPNAATLRLCTLALPGDPPGLGDFSFAELRDGVNVTVTSTVSREATCGTVPAAVRLADGPQRRSVTVTTRPDSSSVTFSEELPVPSAPAVVVPSRAGDEVRLVLQDGTVLRRRASSKGCTVFPALPSGTVQVVGGPRIVVPAVPGGKVEG